MVKYIIVTIIGLTSIVFGTQELASVSIDGDTTVTSVLEGLGEDYSATKPKLNNMSGVQIGEDIIRNGFSKRDDLKKAKRQSKHFVCTSCHNLEREDPDLSISDPQARLDYVVAKGIPFLQGTTLYGAVNRTSFYNDDYYKKYGDLIEPAKNDIREAIQLCAQECAQGRELKDWEIESVLAYLWTIELKVSDLGLSSDEIETIESALNDPAQQTEAVSLIKSKYLQGSPATFLTPPEDRTVGTGLTGNTKNGKKIYDNSCLHCHYQKKYSFLHLDDNKLSFRYLNNGAPSYNRHSLYQVTRYGTYSLYGKKSYMPNYTAEKMSDQQLADLRAYIKHRALQ
jgi:mono/diheme cytochrome c family protein